MPSGGAAAARRRHPSRAKQHRGYIGREKSGLLRVSASSYSRVSGRGQAVTVRMQSYPRSGRPGTRILGSLIPLAVRTSKARMPRRELKKSTVQAGPVY